MLLNCVLLEIKSASLLNPWATTAPCGRLTVPSSLTSLPSTHYSFLYVRALHPQEISAMMLARAPVGVSTLPSRRSFATISAVATPNRKATGLQKKEHRDAGEMRLISTLVPGEKPRGALTLR